MKKKLYAVVSLMLCMVLIIAAIPFSGAAASFYDTAELLQIKSHIEKDAGMSKYATVQGACTDGVYAYFAVQEYSTVILKYDMSTWKLKKKATVSGLGHANDMTYNTKEDIIVVANNNTGTDVLTLLDPDSLEVIGTVEPKRSKTAKEKEADKNDKKDYKVLNVYSIAYQESQNRYVVGLSGTYNFAVLDDKFKQVKAYKGVNTGYTRQGCDCDDDYIYFPQSDGDNIVVVYDYAGKHVDTVTLGHKHEVENLFHVDDSFFLTLHYYGNSVQRVGFSDDTKIRFNVRYDPGEGSGEMEKTSVHYGEDTKLRKNTFTRPGYFFAGWKISRGYDGKSIGLRLGSEKNEWLEPKDLYDYGLYPDEKKVSELTRIGDVTATAFWINEWYDIYFDPGTGEGWMDPITADYADVITVPENQFTRYGYVFCGFEAQRDCDGRIYGYYEGSDTPRWLEPKDVVASYPIMAGEEVSRLTYDGSVTFTAQFLPAFNFDEEQRTLLSYIGIDELVEIPNPSGNLHTIAQGAFSDNTIMKELVVPSTVEEMEPQAISNCSALEKISFTEHFPLQFDSECIVDTGPLPLYILFDGQPQWIGYYSGRYSAGSLRNSALAVERAVAAYRSRIV